MSLRRKLFNRTCLVLAGVCLVIGVLSYFVEDGAIITPVQGHAVGVMARQGSVIGVWRKVKPNDYRCLTFHRPVVAATEPPGEPAVGFRYYWTRRLRLVGVPMWFVGGSLALAAFARKRLPQPVPIPVPA